MKTIEAVPLLAALAQETRLAIFRALVQAGPEGLSAGRIAEAVGAPASTLSFHLKELAAAGLVRSRQEGRFIFYSAAYDAMSALVAFLTEKCCPGHDGAAGGAHRPGGGVVLSHSHHEEAKERRMKNDFPALPVAVIGAGPIGLAAAAHLLERGFAPIVFEAGATIASHLESFRHVQLFSPWRYNIDPAARRLLEATSWQSPPLDELPTAGTVVDRYLAPLADLAPVASALRLSHRVLDISRDGFDKVKSRGRDDAAFVIRARTPDGVREFRARAVIDASGTWGTPNPLGANGLPAIGEAEHADRIAYGMPDILGRDRARYAGKRVLVAGAGHSPRATCWRSPSSRRGAADAPRMDDSQQPLRAHIRRGRGRRPRGTRRPRPAPEAARGERPPRGDRRVPHGVDPPRDGQLVVEGRGWTARRGASKDRRDRRRDRRPARPAPCRGAAPQARSVDREHRATGAAHRSERAQLRHRAAARPSRARPSRGALLRRGREELRARAEFPAGTGHEQVRSVAAALAGDLAAADDVQLELPRTGVCSTQFDEASSGCCAPGEAQPLEAKVPEKKKSSCCGGPPVERQDACCSLVLR
jgi:DNA-binding transcriptional ArsR family regulator